jgi:hypothetical protein
MVADSSQTWAMRLLPFAAAAYRTLTLKRQVTTWLLTRQCQREMPLYQSVTVPLRQRNGAACVEAEEQD